MDGEFWAALKADILRILSEAGAYVGDWAISDSGQATLLGIAAGLLAGWIVVGLYFRRLRRRLDWLAHRLESSAVHLESSVDQLQSEIMLTNRHLAEQIKKQKELPAGKPSSDRLPEPISDFGDDWTQIVGGVAEQGHAPKKES